MDNYKENTKRKDLLKYKQPTKIISFRCSLEYKGKGLDARNQLSIIFKALINIIKAELNGDKKLKQFKRDWNKEVNEVNQILALDILKEGD